MVAESCLLPVAGYALATGNRQLTREQILHFVHEPALGAASPPLSVRTKTPRGQSRRKTDLV
jgi:hypothetical protein